jgi:CRP-like cAMP-binding protein
LFAFVLRRTRSFPLSSGKRYTGVRTAKKGVVLHEIQSGRDTDFDRLRKFDALSSLSSPALILLAGALALSDFRRYEIILREAALASEANILMRGVARVTCLGAHGERVTVALLAPGPIPEFPSHPISRSDFQCEAYSDCRVGSLTWRDFDRILLNSSESAVKTFHENDLKHWYRLLLRSSSFFSLGLHERIGTALLELCSDFGIEDARGTLLSMSFSHQDIASLVGATRPRVTEHLAQLERENILIRQGRQFIVCADKLDESMNMHLCKERDIHNRLADMGPKPTASLKLVGEIDSHRGRRIALHPSHALN